MNKHEKRLSELCTVASDVSLFDKNRHAAAIYIGNRLISVGVNRFKSHPLQARFRPREDSNFLHAEIDALRNALKRVDAKDLQKATIYIARMRNGERRLSKPCEGCQKAIEYYKIPHVFWTL